MQETDGDLTPCFEALALLKQLKADHKRTLPENTPLAFVPTRLLPFMHKAGKLDTSLQWGDGKPSASDGQRFAWPRKVLQQTYSPKFRDFALEFCSFIADNYAPFFSMPIECTDRDAAFVLDGLC